MTFWKRILTCLGFSKSEQKDQADQKPVSKPCPTLHDPYRGLYPVDNDAPAIKIIDRHEEIMELGLGAKSLSKPSSPKINDNSKNWSNHHRLYKEEIVERDPLNGEEFTRQRVEEHAKTIEAIKAKANLQSLIPDPINYLGESYDGILNWDHPDDLFVDFQIMGSVVVDDVAFFMNYVMGTLPVLDKEKYPSSFHQCSVETEEALAAEIRQTMLTIEEDSGCFLVVFENTMGLLLVNSSDFKEIRRRSFGAPDEDVLEQLHYLFQFMRFSPEAIARLDFVGSPKEHYEHQKKRFPPIRVNFATYKEIEKTP